MRWRRVVAVVVVGGVLTGLSLFLPIFFSKSTNQKVLGQRIDWPQTPYAEVRGFFYNAEGNGSVPIIEDGELHKSVLDRNGVLLNASQIERLLDAVARPHSDFNFRVACYFPRHAFVFFDEMHHPVAYVEICFSCFGENTSPRLPHRVGHAELQRLCHDLSLPFFEGRNSRQQYVDYAARHSQKQPSREDFPSSTSASGDR